MTDVWWSDAGKAWFVFLFVMFASAALPILVLPAVVMLGVACWASWKATQGDW